MMKIQYIRIYGNTTDNNTYYVIRGQLNHVIKTANKIATKNYTNLVSEALDPNPFHSWNLIKNLMDAGAKELLTNKKRRGTYKLVNARCEFGYYRSNYLICTRDRLDSLLAEVQRQREAYDK